MGELHDVLQPTLFSPLGPRATTEDQEPLRGGSHDPVHGGRHDIGYAGYPRRAIVRSRVHGGEMSKGEGA